jgi:peptide/nickel transport system ATP-binding protein
VFDRCCSAEPQLQQITPGQFAACHLHDLPAAENPMAGENPRRSRGETA